MDKELQLEVSDRERSRMAAHIYQDMQAARENHDRRILRFRRLYRMWRGISGAGTREDGAEFQLPMLKWFQFGHWSRCMQALLGDDAQIIAIPTAPVDQKDAKMAGDYMSWRFFEYMQATNPLTVWMFRTILWGVGHAELIYEQEYFWERQPSGKDVEKLCYDGPRLRPLWPSQIVLPAQDEIGCIDDYEWTIRRRRVTPQQLLDGERRGRYQHVKDQWGEICSFAKQRQERDYLWDDERIDADIAEGVEHQSVLGNRDSLDLWEWYGKWRMPKGNQDAKEDNLDRRSPQQSELLIKYLAQAQLIVGIQDLRDLYPRMKKRRPFLDVHLVKDGSYWGPGLGELLEEIQTEGTVNYNLFRRAGIMSVGPLVFYKPGGGMDPETFEYKPFMMVPTEDPNSVNVVRMDAKLEYPMEMAQFLKGTGELVTGVSDTLNNQTTAGSTPAQRTASGQAMLIQEGNVRAQLDMTMLREDLSQALGYCWALDRELGDEEVFFRATGKDAGGLYDVDKGFGRMTAEQREHDFGFDLKFATSIWSREAKKQAIMALYQLSVQNPIVAQNPVALWGLLNKVWDAFGEKNFEEILPEPPEQDAPKTPQVEWELMLKGDMDQVHVNPLDDDLKHLLDHRKRLEQAVAEPEERQNKMVQHEAVKHILDHERQRRQKMLLQAAFQAHMQAMQQAQGTGGQAGPGGLGPAYPAGPTIQGAPPQPFPGAGGGGGGGGDVAAAANAAGPAGVGAP
jgi:hypothetical protein